MFCFKKRIASCVILPLFCLYGCSNTGVLPEATTRASLTTDVNDYQYLIGPGDRLNIFVWRNPELSAQVVVRPDGKVTTSLVEDLDVAGRTPTMLAREIEDVLSTFVSVGNFSGPLSEQVRVIGEAAQPRAVNYTEHMTLLDLMISVGGLTNFADGNDAKLIRVINGEKKVFELNIDDLIRDGDIKENVDMLPGDIVIIPEAWF